MPIAPDGTPLPYGPEDPGAMGDQMQDPAAMGMGAAPAAPPFASLDAGALTQMAMAIIAQQADLDAEQFAQAQQQVMTQLPMMIQAIVDQLAAPPPETLDQPGGMQAAGMQAPPGQPGEEELMAMLMSQGAMG